MEDFFESELNLIIRTKNVVYKNIQTNVAVNLMFEQTSFWSKRIYGVVTCVSLLVDEQIGMINFLEFELDRFHKLLRDVFGGLLPNKNKLMWALKFGETEWMTKITFRFMSFITEYPLS